MSTWAYRIAMLNDEELERGVKTAPHYEVQAARAVRRTIQVIHGLADLHDTADLHELEVYLGRASENTLLNRMRFHLKEKGHKYGAVLFRCPSERVNALEKTGIRILQILKDNDALCVGDANVAGDGRGRPAADGTAIVYLTWRKLSEAVDYSRPNSALIRDVALAVEEHLNGEFTARQIETGLSSVRRLNEKEVMEFYPD